MAKEKRYSINEILEDSNLLEKENCYGFNDWFCSTTSLPGKSKVLMSKVKFLVKQGIIDGDKCYVWFRNNCPCVGSLYDDIRFSTIKDHHYLGGISPSSGHKYDKGECCVWSFVKEIETEEDRLRSFCQETFNSWSDFKKKIRTDSVFKALMIEYFTYPEEVK